MIGVVQVDSTDPAAVGAATDLAILNPLGAPARSFGKAAPHAVYAANANRKGTKTGRRDLGGELGTTATGSPSCGIDAEDWVAPADCSPDLGSDTSATLGVGDHGTQYLEVRVDALLK